MDEVLTLQQVADYLRLERSTVYKMVKRDGLPASKLPTMSGGYKTPHYRVLKSLLDRWLDTQTVRMDFSDKGDSK